MGNREIETSHLSISGFAKDATDGINIPMCPVALFQNDILISSTITDLDGAYYFKLTTLGTYSLNASYLGYNLKKIDNIVIDSIAEHKLDIDLTLGPIFTGPIITRSTKSFMD